MMISLPFKCLYEVSARFYHCHAMSNIHPARVNSVDQDQPVVLIKTDTFLLLVIEGYGNYMY